MKRPTAISLSPNIDGRDIFLATKLFFSPWKTSKGTDSFALEHWFKTYYTSAFAFSFSSGRGALYAVLRALDIQKGDEVLLQSFTCVAVPNAVLWSGATPVYVDASETLTIDVNDLKKKITKKTKAVIVQYTFGIPPDMQKIQALLAEKKIALIEDAAHIIGASYQKKKIGTFGIASIFSFGRDKAFSSVFGGIAMTNDSRLGKSLEEFYKKQTFPSFFWTMQQLFHPIASFLILSLYDSFSIGKGLLVLFQKMHMLSFPVLQKEKKGERDAVYTKKMPNALASLALFQLKRLESFNMKREKITALYQSELRDTSYVLPYANQPFPLLRFPVLSKNRDALIAYFKTQQIYLGTWYSNGVDPKGVDFSTILYSPEKCPKAEDFAKQIFNLPTYPNLSLEKAKKIVALLKLYDNNTRNN